MLKSTITIKMNGSTNAVIIDGHSFDRNAMTAQQRRGLADVLKDALFAPKTESRAPRQVTR